MGRELCLNNKADPGQAKRAPGEAETRPQAELFCARIDVLEAAAAIG
jgi:hypothetical protein